MQGALRNSCCNLGDKMRSKPIFFFPLHTHRLICPQSSSRSTFTISPQYHALDTASPHAPCCSAHSHAWPKWSSVIAMMHQKFRGLTRVFMKSVQLTLALDLFSCKVLYQAFKHYLCCWNPVFGFLVKVSMRPSYILAECPSLTRQFRQDKNIRLL